MQVLAFRKRLNQRITERRCFLKYLNLYTLGSTFPQLLAELKKWLPYFSFLFLSERPLPCVILAYERGGRICGRNPSDRRYPGACGRCVLWRGIWSLPDNVELLRKEYLQLAEPYPFSEGTHRKMSEKHFKTTDS